MVKRRTHTKNCFVLLMIFDDIPLVLFGEESLNRIIKNADKTNKTKALVITSKNRNVGLNAN